MGVVNVTPNSYYANSRLLDPQQAIQRGLEMVAKGASFIDVGGECTSHSRFTDAERTDKYTSPEEECARILPVIQGLSARTTATISVDTRRPTVAQAAVEAGAGIINDISGFRDPAMVELAASVDAKCVIMHMQGDPETMQINPSYPEGVVPTVLRYLEIQAQMLVQAGVNEERIIVDPGICFGKTLRQNYELLEALPQIKSLGFPVLLGISRKSLIKKILDKPTQDLLPATLALSTVLILGGVDILRVHDVEEHSDIIKLFSHEGVVPQL